MLRSWYGYATRWLTGLVPFLTRVRAPPAARVHELLLCAKMLLLMMAVLEDIFPLDLCTPSTCQSADTSACISTTSWMQQSGVYRRQKASRLIVVSGELVALYSLAQHRRSTPCHCVTFQVVKNGTYGAPQLV